MGEYLNREKLQDKLRKKWKFFREVKEHNVEYAKGFWEALAIVENFPSTDVAPERHGHWVLNESAIGQKQYFCSECKDDYYWKKCFCFGDEKCCPNCGARMDGEQHEQAN